MDESFYLYLNWVQDDFVPDEFFYGVLDYYFAVGVWGFRLWAWDEFFKAVACRQQFAILHNLARVI